ncbi:MAG: Gfo/Idh/MocA family oxidoreductase [Gammaproteobacteria bacterium]|nr:Gfo/Idh/MocA family oxidoreductase [Gammaproteobacteria bacterium]
MRWGLIGASNIAARHMIGAFRAAGGEVAAVMSADAARGRAFAEAHDIARAAASVEDLLGADIDAVYISTTNEKHLAQALAAVTAGKHVLCEKPLALTVADARAMVRAADDAGVVFATNHHLRNAGSHLAIKQLIDDGRIGEVLSMRIFHAVLLPDHLRGWRIDNPSAGGGVILDIVVHDADTARFHLDEDPVQVAAMDSEGALGRGVEDSVMSVWRMPSGVMVQTHESFTHPHAGSGLEVHGTAGSITARDVMTQRPVGEVALRTAGATASTEAVAFSGHNLYIRAVERFMRATVGEGAPAATGLDGVKSLAVAAAVKQASVSGAQVAVDYGDAAAEAN